MNPFLWKGPQFLMFYAGFAIVLIALLHVARRWIESGQSTGRIGLNDPYTLAYLRGGKNETIRMATVSLIERGWLELRDGTDLIAGTGHRPLQGKDPLEGALLRFFDHRRPAPDAFKAPRDTWESTLQPRRETLERANLVPDSEARRKRLWLAGMGALLLVAVAGFKLYIAYVLGKSNIGFLIALTLLALLILMTVVYNPRRTPQGDAVLKDMRGLLEKLRLRVYSGSPADELVLVAAVFGLAALPATAMPYVPALYPQAAKGDAGSGDGCGSSCGSGCGGGGCGGGCGGCGS